jgi:hypothetical protein
VLIAGVPSLTTSSVSFVAHLSDNAGPWAGAS